MSDTELDSLPLFPLGTPLVPSATFPLHIFEERYRKLMRDSRRDDPAFGVVLIRAGREVIDRPEIRKIGTAASFVEAVSHPDGRWSIAVRGSRRFRVHAEDWSTDYLTARIEWLPEPLGDPAGAPILAERLAREWQSFVLQIARLAVGRDEAPALAASALAGLPAEPTALAYDVIAKAPLTAGDRQTLLELDTTTDRLAALSDLLARDRKLMRAFGGDVSLPYAIHRPVSPN